MNGVEILFIVSVILLSIMWGWFIVLGFRTSRLWGAALILLFPISPFLFAYRFERKTRQFFYYFIGSLVFFALMLLYIQFATSVDFYPNLSHKLSKALPSIGSSAKPKVKNLNLPPPAYIPPPLPKESEVVAEEPEITPAAEETAKPSSKTRGYKTIDVGSAGGHIGKNAIIKTATVIHRGKITAVDASQIEIQKRMGGGFAKMSVRKSKITNIQVYF